MRALAFVLHGCDPEATHWRFTPLGDGRIRIERFQVDQETNIRTIPLLEARAFARVLLRNMGSDANWSKSRVEIPAET